MTVVQPDTPDFLQLVDPGCRADPDRFRLRVHRRARRGAWPSRPLLQRHPRRQALPMDRVGGHGADHGPDLQGQRHGLRHRGSADRVRARRRARSPAFTPTAITRRCASTTRASTSTAPTISSPAAATAASTSPIPTTAGGTTGSACKREPLLGFKAVFRVPHEGGEAQLVVDPDEFEQPNGLCFSPDESLMYVNDSPRAEVKVFDVADDGMLVNGRSPDDRDGRRHDR